MASELLLHTLEDLEERDLKTFKWFLRQYGAVEASKLEKADFTDIVDIMMECFGLEEAVQKTLNILRKMNQNQLAEDLQNKWTDGNKGNDREREAA